MHRGVKRLAIPVVRRTVPVIIQVHAVRRTIAIGIVKALVHLTVTVVVFPVACLFCGLYALSPVALPHADTLGLTGGAVRQRELLAAGSGITVVRGAGVPVLTDHGDAGDARGGRAHVPLGACVVVIALFRIGRKHAARVLVAGIVGADVVVAADELAVGGALAKAAMIAQSTQVFVIARGRVRLVNAPECDVAGIIRANIAVVAIQQPRCRADTVQALLVHGARVAVVAIRLVGNLDTAHHGIARIVGTRIAVIAGQGRPPDALPVEAAVRSGADIVVIAGKRVVFINAPRRNVAIVVGARVVIRTIGSRASSAYARVAELPNRACIPIVTSEALELGFKRAFAAVRVAHALQADRIKALRFRTFDDAARHYRTDIGQALLVTEQLAVAHVAILQHGAIIVGLTLTVHSIALALPLRTLIAYGARIAVVTVRAVGRKKALAAPLTRIVRAQVPIVANDRRSHADPLFAMVADSARIAIHALGSVEGSVEAPGLAGADVLGTLIPIIAQVHVVAARIVGFVHQSVAVIIYAVAALVCGDGRVAVGESLFGTDPLANTGSPLIHQFAGRGKTQLHRLVGTRADSRIRDALVQDAPFRGLHFLARESVGAPLLAALSPAEAALSRVPDASIVRSSDTLAVVVSRTRLAQVAEIGHTDIHNVRIGSRHLSATPSGRALRLTVDGADPFPHVLHAPA